MQFYKPSLIALLFILLTGKLFATHYYGVDLFYTHVSGNTYRVTIVSYGDCSGAQFPSFSASRPRVHIRQGSVNFLSDFLDHEPPQDGVEVTPVCPAELDNTTCKTPTGTVPGVKKFVYSKEFTLSGPAPDWKFIYLGETDGTTIAGRSNSLTNVAPPGIIRLEATLDNTQNANSSPRYTTIATPFYCISRQVNFNPGAVDTDGDSLVYELVPGMDTATLVTYKPGFSGSNPLDVTSNSFKFNSKTGQLNFTPGTIQRSLVVYRVSEYRNGILLGTSMREMTVVVMTCNNNPPAGYIANALGATIVDSVTVTTCKGNHEVSFDIDPADADQGHTINMVGNGLPDNSTLNITGNNTASPKSRFVWNMPELPEGDYTFYVTYTDDGCPIASKQTQAYTIRIKAEDIFAEATDANCENKGLVKVTVPEGWSPWSYVINSGATRVYNKTGVSGRAWQDSLAPGKYNIQAINYFGCMAETAAEIFRSCDILDIPNAFSPNGDGKNDALYARGENIQEMDLRIYNRWGELVFQSRDISIGWDGRYKGADQPMEAYGYVLSAIFKSGRSFYKKGNITLLR
jgi:gliding motility-associated-like protein